MKAATPVKGLPPRSRSQAWSRSLPGQHNAEPALKDLRGKQTGEEGKTAATKRSESQTETTLDLIVRDALSSIKFSQARVYLG
jgi:hypothetical protein